MHRISYAIVEGSVVCFNYHTLFSEFSPPPQNSTLIIFMLDTNVSLIILNLNEISSIGLTAGVVDKR